MNLPSATGNWFSKAGKRNIIILGDSMGYLKQVKGMLLLGESPQAICNKLGLSPDTLYRFIELEAKQRNMPLRKPSMNRGGFHVSREMMRAAMFNPFIN